MRNGEPPIVSTPPQPDWDARYAGDEYLFGTEPNEFLTRCRALIPDGARVLCVADGEGRNSVWLASQGFAVDAFDASNVAVEKARRLASVHGVSVRLAVADAANWPWPKQRYDVVAAIFIQFAPPELRRWIFSRIHTALVPGGLLLLEGYHRNQLRYRTGGPQQAEQLYTEDQISSELSAFAIERLSVYDSEVREGAAHSGMSALLDVVARRPLTPGEG